jgi:hypothetical protein
LTDVLHGLTLRGKQPQEVDKAHDGDGLETFQLEKMPVAGHDEIRARLNSALENLIVSLVLDCSDPP